MPLQNRVNPFGSLVAVPQRYELPAARFGNRGVLHNNEKKIVRNWKSKAWLVCVLTGTTTRLQREPMTPGRYTELFFLDDYVALAAGHRPCASCRRRDFEAFKKAVGISSARQVDDALHAERLLEQQQKRPAVPIDTLPNGTFIHYDDDAFLLWENEMHRFTHDGYADRQPARGLVAVPITPETTIDALRTWTPGLPHESALARS